LRRRDEGGYFFGGGIDFIDGLADYTRRIEIVILVEAEAVDAMEGGTGEEAFYVVIGGLEEGDGDQSR